MRWGRLVGPSHRLELSLIAITKPYLYCLCRRVDLWLGSSCSVLLGPLGGLGTAGPFRLFAVSCIGCCWRWRSSTFCVVTVTAFILASISGSVEWLPMPLLCRMVCRSLGQQSHISHPLGHEQECCGVWSWCPGLVLWTACLCCLISLASVCPFVLALLFLLYHIWVSAADGKVDGGEVLCFVHCGGFGVVEASPVAWTGCLVVLPGIKPILYRAFFLTLYWADLLEAWLVL